MAMVGSMHGGSWRRGDRGEVLQRDITAILLRKSGDVANCAPRVYISCLRIRRVVVPHPDAHLQVSKSILLSLQAMDRDPSWKSMGFEIQSGVRRRKILSIRYRSEQVSSSLYRAKEQHGCKTKSQCCDLLHPTDSRNSQTLPPALSTPYSIEDRDRSLRTPTATHDFKVIIAKETGQSGRRSDMDDMGGMSMGSGSSAMFQTSNKAIARGFWYAVTAVLACLAIIRIASNWQAYSRRRSIQTRPHIVPSRTSHGLSRWHAAVVATFREITYGQPWIFTGPVSKYFTPLPIGHWLLLAVYWAALLICLWSDVILSPENPMYPYKWEKVGFRGAWVSITQVPFIYLLSCKVNPISLVTGISYERLNWLHRWTARTLFLTVIVHWSFFFHEWVLADFVRDQLDMMVMVRYGFGAWAVIGWMVLSGFGYLRAKAYELFVLQHIAAAGTLLWLLHKHVPSYAQYNIHFSITVMLFDWGLRIIWNVLRNTHILGRLRQSGVGYACRLESLSEDMVRVRIQNVDFRWKAGQHVYLSLPAIRPFELHPFTIANRPSGESGTELVLLIQSQKGFTESIARAAAKGEQTSRSHRAFLSGPFGMPPDISHYDTVILIAASSGASFIMPLVSDLVRNKGCVRRVSLHWTIARRDHVEWFKQDLPKLVEQARDNALGLQVSIHVTRESAASQHQQPHVADMECFETIELQSAGASSPGHSRRSSSVVADEKALLSPYSSVSVGASIKMHYGGRPSIENMIRGPVETALGETAIVVCGGPSITAQVRTFAAALSDERAVHKGTGAQGIFLFTESYGW